jgi:2-polyprenyl-3-methyl-5-hydroxy-6-metoxy-1,4-benzoquinol methylase
MRTSIFNSTAARHLDANFRTIDKTNFDLLELSLRNNYFTKFPEGYLLTDWGQRDLENHLCGRLDVDRNMIVPWLDDARTLRATSILEIGCGTGSSTVALAEQGAKVTAIDVDASSLVVASERCQAYSLDVSFIHANATEVYKLFAGQHFDYIIFYAALEHLTMEERMSAMRATWQMLSVGGLWCVIETPNRLWYYDAHTSLLPFHMWLPDELAFAYSRFSPRDNYRELYREYTDESKLHFLRRGRGVSFHEFELTMKPVRALRIKSSLDVTNKGKGLRGFLKWRFSSEYKYISLLRKIAPELHEGFLQSYLYLIIEKD